MSRDTQSRKDLGEDAIMSATTTMPLEVQSVDGALIVRLSAVHVDASNCDHIFQMLAACVQRDQPQLLIINMQRVSYFHSVAIGRLMDMRRQVATYGGRLIMCRLNSQPLEILSITRVDQLLMIIDSEPTQFPVDMAQTLAAAQQPLLPRRSPHQTAVASVR